MRGEIRGGVHVPSLPRIHHMCVAVKGRDGRGGKGGKRETDAAGKEEREQMRERYGGDLEGSEEKETEVTIARKEMVEEKCMKVSEARDRDGSCWEGRAD